jgi:hypothetical protein
MNVDVQLDLLSFLAIDRTLDFQCVAIVPAAIGSLYE